MRFPKRISLLLAKIALERVMSPERAEELVEEARGSFREIAAWWNGRETNPAERVTVEDATDEAVQKLKDALPPEMQDEAAGLVRRIEDRLAEQLDNHEMNGTLVGEIIKSEIVGKSNTWVIWLDHAEIVGSGGGRYVHFSYFWDKSRNRYGYRIRDYEQNIMFYPPDTQAGGSGWNVRVLPWTADEVWVAARRRIRTINETGLGETRLKSVDKNKVLWKEVLNVLSKNLPVIAPHGQEP